MQVGSRDTPGIAATNILGNNTEKSEAFFVISDTRLSLFTEPYKPKFGYVFYFTTGIILFRDILWVAISIIFWVNFTFGPNILKTQIWSLTFVIYNGFGPFS